MELPSADILKMTLGVVCEDFDVDYPKGELSNASSKQPSA